MLQSLDNFISYGIGSKLWLKTLYLCGAFLGKFEGRIRKVIVIFPFFTIRHRQLYRLIYSNDAMFCVRVLWDVKRLTGAERSMFFDIYTL